MGMMLRLTEIRGSRSQPAAAHAARYSAICSACSSSNGTPVSSVSRVELIRFMPCSAAHTAVLRVPEPHQIRSGSPGDCGWIISAPETPPVICGFARAMPAPSIAARNSSVWVLAMSASDIPSPGRGRTTRTRAAPFRVTHGSRRAAAGRR